MIKIILASPRGFCAGVTRAIEIVERALLKYGPPVYVRHEIVHNKYVVDSLKQKGAIFVDEIDDIPKNSVTIFSAHGVSKKVIAEAKYQDLQVIDATCPLVTKVHNEAIKAELDNRQLIIIGHRDHAEVQGTSGQVEQNAIIISNVEDVEKIKINDPEKLSYVTQTTLSVDDTKSIIGSLLARFPNIQGPDIRDICYATQNRQNAVKQLAKVADIILVIGSKNSSNSNRLKDLAEEIGVKSYLIDSFNDIDLNWFDNKTNNIGITAGASAPETLVDQVLNFFNINFNIEVSSLETIVENMRFKLPKILTQS